MVGTKHRLSELEENIPESQHLLTKKQRKSKNVEERDFHGEEEQVSSEMEYEEEGDEDEIDPELVIPFLSYNINHLTTANLF